MNTYKKEVLFSTLLFSSAAILTFSFHELGHAFFTRYFSIAGVIFQNRVDIDFSLASKKELIWIGLGGSLFSLLQFILIYPFTLLLNTQNRFLQLFMTWLAFWSATQFFGYIFIGFLPMSDDISGVYNLLAISNLVRIPVSFASFFILSLSVRQLIQPMLKAMNLDFTDVPVKQAKAIVLIPGILFTLLFLLLNLNSRSLVSVIYPLSTPFLLAGIYFKIRKSKSLKLVSNGIKPGDFAMAVILFTACICLSLKLSSGIIF